ncbi:hypothetical protein Slin15195_G021910 [Septoria linicola]|uniref:Uncharacterized protein n=1 Tax=Septoria linicola TaxID=215465 RepID=A0A9Q9EGJ2_9PEZI|nr:hypothetical protein Slin14017_G130380 [Septoria linicola]USW48872.1 hypothetical protein Slin15195_G021910 [Septoria linicola]
MVLFQFFDIPMDVSANGRLVQEIPEQCRYARYRLGYWRLTTNDDTSIAHTGKTWIIKGGGDSSEHQYLKVLAANAIFGVIPALLISMVPYGIAALDPVHRFMQPLYNMSRQECDAKDCILLEYLSRSPFAVSKDAFDRGYWKVCSYSILGSLPELLVLLLYGIPMITSVPLVGEDGPRISVVMCDVRIFHVRLFRNISPATSLLGPTTVLFPSRETTSSPAENDATRSMGNLP